jgi:hypothetical protein
MDVAYFPSKARFHFSDHANAQKNRGVWSATNPQEIKDTPLHDPKFGVWCVMSRNLVVGDGSVNPERYCQVNNKARFPSTQQCKLYDQSIFRLSFIAACFGLQATIIR